MKVSKSKKLHLIIQKKQKSYSKLRETGKNTETPKDKLNTKRNEILIPQKINSKQK